ncbi:MAG TPA: sigma-70 family RNA polymerase sigma factor [Vicinamibacterales bacterium]|jgi:RNA polymerase sigma-70 factor (ECF subfamily)|nr:sigma-70 family RNA polymerase sigma factor [Vicinamibacterales bacterium]
MAVPLPHDQAPDEQLLPRIAAGDTQAFALLFRRRQAAVYRFALHMAGTPAVAEDVTQDVFVEVMRVAARYEPGRSNVISWLYGIARNCARRRLERDRNLEPLTDQDERDDAATFAVHPDPLGDLTREESIARLREAILSLPFRYRETVVLCDLQELSYAEAADALGCPVGTVRSRLHRGRELLTTKLAAERNWKTPLKLPGVRSIA